MKCLLLSYFLPYLMVQVIEVPVKHGCSFFSMKFECVLECLSNRNREESQLSNLCSCMSLNKRHCPVFVHTTKALDFGQISRHKFKGEKTATFIHYTKGCPRAYFYTQIILIN